MLITLLQHCIYCCVLFADGLADLEQGIRLGQTLVREACIVQALRMLLDLPQPDAAPTNQSTDPSRLQSSVPAAAKTQPLETEQHERDTFGSKRPRSSMEAGAPAITLSTSHFSAATYASAAAAADSIRAPPGRRMVRPSGMWACELATPRVTGGHTSSHSHGHTYSGSGATPGRAREGEGLPAPGCVSVGSEGGMGSGDTDTEWQSARACQMSVMLSHWLDRDLRPGALCPLCFDCATLYRLRALYRLQCDLQLIYHEQLSSCLLFLRVHMPQCFQRTALNGF